MADAPIRWTRGKASVELSYTRYALIHLWRLATWAARRTKPVLYHPIALAGITVYLLVYALQPWAACALLWGAVGWAPIHPDSYLRHAQPRIDSFRAGFRYRWRPRKRLTACRTLRETDSIPTISRVTKNGCITTVRVKMCPGHHIEWWREDARALAQTYNAGDCKINPYRRPNYTTIKIDSLTRRPPYVKYHFTENVTKYRWLILEFLTKDPFNSKLGVEYIDYHRAETLSPVVAVHRDGGTHRENLGVHRLRIARSRWGKSVALRAMIYAQRHNIQNGLLELWGIDGKGGVEHEFLKHILVRRAYGDAEADPNAYHPEEFDQLLQDAVTVMKRRQRKMRGFATEHVPTQTEPWLRIIIDELLVLTSKNVPGEMRTRIAANVMLIHQQGIACGVDIDASTQLAQKDVFDKIERDGWTAFEIGKVEPGVVDMVFGKGWHERGARADEIPDDLKGTFYLKTETTMAPEQIRYPHVTVDDVTAEALGFTVGDSVLMKDLELAEAVRGFGFG